MKKIPFLIIGLFLVICSTAQAAGTQQSTQQEQPDRGFTIWPVFRNAIDIYRIIEEMKPGEKKEDYVMVKNSAEKPKTFNLYPIDEEINNGKPFYKNKNDARENIGKWVSIEEPVVTLGPDEEKKIKITLSIPADTPLADYKGGIAMEHVQPSAKNPNLNIATRLILGIQIKVTDNPQPVPQFVQANIFNTPTPYFWVSTGIFLASAGYFIYASRKEKKLADKNKSNNISE